MREKEHIGCQQSIRVGCMIGGAAYKNLPLCSLVCLWTCHSVFLICYLMLLSLGYSNSYWSKADSLRGWFPTQLAGREREGLPTSAVTPCHQLSVLRQSRDGWGESRQNPQIQRKAFKFHHGNHWDTSRVERVRSWRKWPWACWALALLTVFYFLSWVAVLWMVILPQLLKLDSYVVCTFFVVLIVI